MKRLRLLLLGMSFLGVLLVPSLARADVSNFTVTNFQADETLTKADPQGQLRIVEHINVDFTDYNHGILRAIPDRYKGHSLQLKVNSITSDSGAVTQYTTYGSNGNTVLKIGNPNSTVTGPQEYTIDYTMRNVISFYKDHDELYWNVNGDQWDQPFDKVAVTLHLPSDVSQSEQSVCYAGSQGSTAQACTISTSGDTITAVTTQPLLANQTLTFVAGFKSGYFTPSKWYQTLGEYLKPILEFAIPVLLLGGGSGLYWFARGRDPKGTGIIVPQYDAPDGLKPAEVGTIVDFKLDNRDITATIIDLAVRRYLKIIETTKDKLIGSKKTYSLQLTNADISALDNNEVLLLKALFPGLQVGDMADVSALKTKLYITAKSLSNNIESGLTSAGYFRSNPLNAGKGLTVLLAVLAFGVFYLGHLIGFITSAGIFLGAGIGYLFISHLAARTAKGVAAQEHISGLKMYLNVAEKDRINALQSPDAKYAAPSVEPVKTVELFEKLLPYAMVLGVEKNWAGKFEDLYKSPPDWYAGGNWTTFNAYYLATSLNEGIGSAVNSAFSAPSSSGSSGFGGGGFSGGGGGGGGGGGW